MWKGISWKNIVSHYGVYNKKSIVETSVKVFTIININLRVRV